MFYTDIWWNTCLITRELTSKYFGWLCISMVYAFVSWILFIFTPPLFFWIPDKPKKKKDSKNNKHKDRDGRDHKDSRDKDNKEKKDKSHHSHHHSDSIKDSDNRLADNTLSDSSSKSDKAVINDKTNQTNKNGESSETSTKKRTSTVKSFSGKFRSTG